MRVKRFLAPTMSAAITMVKAEFGPDAVILGTGRACRPGVFGFFRRRWVAVTAGYEPAPLAHPEPYPPPAPAPPEAALPASAAPEAERLPPASPPPPAQPEQVQPALAGQIKLAELTVTYLMERLRQQEIAAEYLDELREMLRVRVEQGGEAPRWHLWRLLAEHMPVAVPWQNDGRQIVVPLVGPTGVGKTTTIAKLATNYSLLSGWRVGFLTADTYRVAAVEQLRTYADILDVPMEVLYSPQDIPAALARLADRQLILMDTAGRSHHMAEHMAELRSFVEAVAGCRPYLVVNAAMRYIDLMETIDQFAACVPLEGLIVTKLDETRSYGSLYNAVRHSGKPIAFVTDGQSVPEDLAAADPMRLAGLLVGVE